MTRVWHGKTSRLAAGFATVVLLLGAHAATAASIKVPESGGSAPPPAPVIGDIVVNGGFETGSFSGWTVIPAAQGSLVGVDGNPHSGNFAAFFGAITPPFPDAIEQTLATTPGVTYTLSYWLANGGGPQNDFKTTVGGIVVSDVFNSAPFAYTNFTLDFTATSAATVLNFAGYNVPSFFFLDDVSVNAVPEPSSWILGGLGLAGVIPLAIWRRARGA